MRRTILFFALLFFSISIIGQNQNNQWRFGRSGGINFNSSPPSFVSGSSIATGEGSASVADPVTGNLLFYTDGVTVWNAQNTIMPYTRVALFCGGYVVEQRSRRCYSKPKKSISSANHFGKVRSYSSVESTRLLDCYER